MRILLSPLLFLFALAFLCQESVGQTSDYYYESGIAKQELKDFQGSIADFNRAILLETHEELLAPLYYARGTSKALSGNMTGACEDFVISKRLGWEYAGQMYSTFCE